MNGMLLTRSVDLVEYVRSRPVPAAVHQDPQRVARASWMAHYRAGLAKCNLPNPNCFPYVRASVGG